MDFNLNHWISQSNKSYCHRKSYYYKLCTLITYLELTASDLTTLDDTEATADTFGKTLSFFLHLKFFLKQKYKYCTFI